MTDGDDSGGLRERVVEAFPGSDRTKRNLRLELRRSALAKVGLVLVVGVVFVAVFAPFLAPHDPTQTNTNQTQLPPLGFSKTENVTVTNKTIEDGQINIEVRNETRYIAANASYPLGTDDLGRGMLSRVIYGARTSLSVGILGTLLAAVFGVTVGLVAGYYRGLVDDTLMRSADIMLAFPSLVLAIAITGLAGTNQVIVPDPFVAMGFEQSKPDSFVIPGTVVVVVALVNWVWFARVARGEALSIRQEEYVKAARSMGASDPFIIRKHILPNAVTPILVLATIQVAAIILLESALSFLGFSGTTLSWGFDISVGRDFLASSWWIATVPGLAIVFTVIGINLVGDWLRDALDPGIQGEGNA